MAHPRAHRKSHKTGGFKCIVRTKFNSDQEYLSAVYYLHDESSAKAFGLSKMDSYFARYHSLRLVIVEVISPAGKLLFHRVVLRDEWKREMKLV